MDPDRSAPAATLGYALAARLEALRRKLGAWRPDPTVVLRIYFDPAGFLAGDPDSHTLGCLYAERLTIEDRLTAVLVELGEPIEMGAWAYRLDCECMLVALRIDAMGADPKWAIQPK